jgi:hypothetical protein
VNDEEIIRRWWRAEARERIIAGTACEPDGCGAAPGQPCTGYTGHKPGSLGRVQRDVHAVRVLAYGLAQRPA